MAHTQLLELFFVFFLKQRERERARDRLYRRETTDAYQLKADLPGVKKEEVTLDVEDNIIRIGVKRSESESVERESEDKKWHRSERREYSGFQQRALRMPENTDFNTMTAGYENGVLTIDVKKLAEHVGALKKIPIK